MPPSSQHESALKSFLHEPEAFLHVIKTPAKDTLSFEVGGVPFHALLRSEAGKHHLVIWGLLGYLPYSVTNLQKRSALIAVLEGARSLPSVSFGVDSQMRIVAQSTYPLPETVPPDYLFEPLVRFFQEAQPFISLIGENL